MTIHILYNIFILYGVIMESFIHENITVIFSSFFSIIGVIIGILIKYFLDIHLESQKLRNQKKQIIHSKQLDILCEISYTINITIKSLYIMSNISNPLKFKLEFENFVKLINSFDFLINKNILLLNEEIFNKSLLIVNNLTSTASNIKYHIESTYKNNCPIDDKIKSEISKIHEEKMILDNILRKFINISK